MILILVPFHEVYVAADWRGERRVSWPLRPSPAEDWARREHTPGS